MWSKRAHTIYPLTKLCSTRVNFKCTHVDKYYLMEMKKTVGRYVLLSYHNFIEEFMIHTDARKTA